ncbi:carbohydrate-binding protein [Thermococcus gammatolerans]|nr:carbohydrate-binding protein [Thermococcus gammatolerans]
MTMRALAGVVAAMVILSLLPQNIIPGVSAYPSADGSPFDWVYDNVKALDGHDDLWHWYNDGDDYARDLIAFYYSENPDTVTMRIDLMELDVGEESNANWYILMDFAAGGQNALPDGLTDANGNTLSTGMAWDIAIAVYDSSNYNVYFPDWSVHNDVVKAVTLNAEYDFIDVELYKDKIPNFPSGGQVHFQVLSAKDFSSPYRVTDSMPDDIQYYFTSDDRVGTAKVVFVHHANQHIAYSESDVCGGEGTGYDDVIRTHLQYRVPLNLHLSGVLLENLIWNDYTCGADNFIQMIRYGVNSGLIGILTSAYGQQIMPFFPQDLNVKSLGMENALIWELFSYTPKVAWVPERVWETKLSDGDPYNGVKSDPWDYFAATNPANGLPYAEAVVLDANTHGTGKDANGNPINPYKIYELPNGKLKIFFIDDWLKDTIYSSNDWDSDSWTSIKKHWLDFALSPDQEQIDVYADDLEKAAGVAGWPTNPQDYFYAVRYVAAHPWIRAVKLDDVLSWSSGEGGRFWGDGGDYWPVAGTYREIGGTNGYGGTGDVNGDGTPDRNAWYKDWAINYYPYNCPKSAGTLWWEVYQELENLKNVGVDNNLVDLAWTTLMANLYETGWHDGLGGSLSGWEKEISSHLRHALPYAYGAWWLSNTNKPLLAYWKNVDEDNDNEIVVQNDRLYAVLDPIGGRVGWLFDSNGHVVIGNSMALWSGTEGDYNDGNHVWGLSDAYDGGTYEHSYYQLEILEDGTNGRILVRTKSPGGFVKYIELRKGWSYLKVTYRDVSRRIYVKTGFSPGLSDLLRNGKKNIERVWLYDGKVAGYYNRETDTLGAYVLPGPVSFNRGEDWRTLTVADEIKLESDGTFYIYAGPWNASVFGELLSEPLRGSVSFSPERPSAGDTVTIYYNASGGPLEGATSLTLHWGHDGWKDVTDTPMQYSNGVWKVAIETQGSWGSLDFVFTNGSVWDNDGWRDYHIYLSPPSVPASVSDLLTGDECSWGSYLPAPNSGEVKDGEYVWHDANGDVHSTKNYPHPEDNYDIESVRVRADRDYVYFSIRLSDLASIGEFGAPLIAIPISVGTGTNHTIPYDGSLSYSPGWDYWVVVDLSKAGFPDTEILGSPAVEVYDSSFSKLAGDYYAIASKTNSVIQVAIPRELLGNPSSLGFNVLVFLGDSRGGALDPGSPKVVDLMSPSSTDGELSDGSIDYAADVDLTAVLFFGYSPLIVGALLVVLAFAFKRH